MASPAKKTAFSEWRRHGWTKFVSLQPQYNLIYREEEREIFPLCIDRKMALVPWSPLAGSLGYSMAQTSLAWILSKPFITAPIVGTTSVKHIEEAVSALDITLDNETIKKLDTLRAAHQNGSILMKTIFITRRAWRFET